MACHNILPSFSVASLPQVQPERKRSHPAQSSAALVPDKTCVGEYLAARLVPAKPQIVDEVILVIIKGLRRAMHPLTHRRKGAEQLRFANEYDVQDLLHALLRPWVQDVRPEEYTPSYAGKSTRMDLLLPAYELVIETKRVRNRQHAKHVGDELLLDIGHYAAHPTCRKLWCVIYDPEHLLTNPEGLRDLEGEHKRDERGIVVRIFVVTR